MSTRRDRWQKPLLAAFAGTLAAAVAWGQQLPPKPPPPTSDRPAGEAIRVKPPPPPDHVPPPPPELQLSSDFPCVVELNGKIVAELEADVPKMIRIRPGEHLLQAFPKEIEGPPPWKRSIKAPDTGSVVAIIELKKGIEEWNRQQEKQNVRFEERPGAVVFDRDSRLLWTTNVSPAMRWDDALGYCERLEVEGIAGWRLPHLDELSKLYWPDHPSPRQETARTDVQWTILGKKRGQMQVLPRLVHQPFDHNSVSALWVRGVENRVACSFLGAFACNVASRKEQAHVLCTRAPE
jgi:hypothetical protein